MQKSSLSRVVIIGAGIAGLTTAWELKKIGIEALVLEAEQHVGGRMRSIQVDDALIDCGAQFLSSCYSVIPNLIKEVGLTNNLVETSDHVGLIEPNQIVLLNTKKPWQLVSKNVLSIADFIRMGIQQFKLVGFTKKPVVLNDITCWDQYDNELAIDWVVSHFNQRMASKLTATIINGFYFQSLQNSSASLTAAVAAFSAYQPRTLTLTSGMGSLTQQLANNLRVETGVVVSGVTETAHGVKIFSSAGEYEAEHVVLTIPAPFAKKILQQPDAPMSKLLNTPYSSSATISFLANQNWSPPEALLSAYGLLFNPDLNNRIAAIAIENNKCLSRRKNGFLINVMLADSSAKQLLPLSDEDIYAAIQSDVEVILPNLYQNTQNKIISRWPYAMPCTPIGRANAVKEYRATRNATTKIWLAGDYLGFPWTDSAAQTGIWVAEKLKKYLIK